MAPLEQSTHAPQAGAKRKRIPDTDVIDLTIPSKKNGLAERKSAQLKTNASDELTALREKWQTLYAETLPAKARARDPCQPKWPVTLDHCFARIILDNAVGKDKPWAQAVKAPAVKHMSEQQFSAAIQMGEDILNGKVDLVELDEQSLALRGKTSKQNRTLPGNRGEQRLPPKGENSSTKAASDDIYAFDAVIDASDKTDFQKRCLKALLRIPKGRFSTYGEQADPALDAAKVAKTGAMAKSLGSSPRAVGNAMRGNPFAPQVPCHRIIASDGRLGGFGGDWGTEGKHANEKLELLREEGVRFDSKGKVLGSVFTAFNA